MASKAGKKGKVKNKNWKAMPTPKEIVEGDQYRNRASRQMGLYNSGGTVRLASGGPVVDSYDYD